MTVPEPAITVDVDPTNPGQFFACCGLLELADRLWPGAEGWFDRGMFCIASQGHMEELLTSLGASDLVQLDPNDDMASPIHLSTPFLLTLDWWTDKLGAGTQTKVWAGSMRNVRIARAMQHAIHNLPDSKRLFDYAAVVYAPDRPKKKVEPYYFDSRRGCNARSIDIGFAPDALKMKSAAFPAVELLCLIGLQRCRPFPTKQRRVFEYRVWQQPLPVNLASVAVVGALPGILCDVYQFECAFRTDQRKHKAFLPATLIGA